MNFYEPQGFILKVMGVWSFDWQVRLKSNEQSYWGYVQIPSLLPLTPQRLYIVWEYLVPF